MTPWEVDQPVSRLLPAHRTTETSISIVGFKPMTPEFERAMMVHAVDREPL
jgi:hypothetical protein